MDKVLEMRFRNEASNLVTIRVPNVVEPYDPALISLVMDELIAKNIFDGSASILVSKDSARVVSRDVEDISIL